MRVQLKHILKSSQFDLESLTYIFKLTDHIREFNHSRDGLQYLHSLLAYKRAMLFFNQPSTRTFLSFQSACEILGMHTSDIRDPSTSSEAKGESIEDSLRTFSSYVDLVVMRSPMPGLCEQIANMLDATPRPVPIINAGSGPDEHPTQALLDLYTLNYCFRNIGGINGKTICMVGDLKRGRTVRSLCYLLHHYANIKIILCAPEAFMIPEDLRNFMRQCPNVTLLETTNFVDAIANADAIYMTRLQDEYDASGGTKQQICSTYNLKFEHLSMLKPTCAILHPMPRRQEIDRAIDHDPRAQYWAQQRNGMWVRTALIALLFGIDTQVLKQQHYASIAAI